MTLSRRRDRSDRTPSSGQPEARWPTLKTPTAAVAWLVAVQSQDYIGAKWALGLRLGRTSDRVVEDAFTKGAVLRTHVLRPTWHFVAPADIRSLLALTALRVHAAHAHIYRSLSLDSATFRRTDTVPSWVLAGAQYRTREALRDALERDDSRVAPRPPTAARDLNRASQDRRSEAPWIGSFIQATPLLAALRGRCRDGSSFLSRSRGITSSPHAFPLSIALS